MNRWWSFLVGGFTLLPAAIWLVLRFAGLDGTSSFAVGAEEVVMLATLLPLAGIFWIQNLRQLADAMGAASRLRVAERLARLLPVLVLAFGGAGLGWLSMLGRPAAVLLSIAAALAVVATLARLAANAALEPPRAASQTVEEMPHDPDRRGEAAAYGAVNLLMLLAIAALWWSPQVIFWAALGLAPVALATVASIAAWGAGGIMASPRAHRHPASRGRPTPR